MEDLIEALTIFLKYGNPKYPTHCEHDVLSININPNDVTEDDIKRLNKLGFDDDEGHFKSFRFGSC